ncbi:MAG: SprT family zinc-dependent metalloprotease [Candidatus Microsaccharimonas sp.]
MPTIKDEEFGDITVRRSTRSTQVKLKVAPDGTLRASMPLYAPLFLLKRLIKSSRPELRTMLSLTQPKTQYFDGQQIGKSHTLIVVNGSKLGATRSKQHITVTLPPNKTLSDSDVIRKIRDASITALRVEARNYLARRLKYLAEQWGFHYEKVRFSHASSRWGSCSSTGTISLNIALMKLPFELIDYVIVHELAHTVEMNHSQDFWKIVEKGDPAYKQHRRLLKQETPTI